MDNIENEILEGDELQEFKASFGVQAEVPAPIATKSNKRPADKEQGDPMEKLAKSTMIADVARVASAMSYQDLAKVHTDMTNKNSLKSDSKHSDPMPKLKTVKEDMSLVFQGADLSEDFMDKATTIFEAALETRLIEETARLEEEFEQKLDESVASMSEEMTNKLNSYLDYVVEQWVEENRLAIENSLRADVTENFLAGLKDLFLENYIEIPENKVDVVEELSAKVEELTAELNDQINLNVQIAEQVKAFEKVSAFEEVAEGLSDTQADKLAALAESIEAGSLEEFKRKLTVIKESYLTAKKSSNVEQQLNEEVEVVEEPVAKKTDPAMEKYLQAISRTVKN
jgi:hypothetical protein